ncbi:Diaminopimelate decarboxylase [Candidatus Vidania fulgoroideae]|nr:Diaminopimelate decarboxylase [Candidatus Vidania fulgoroideae]
MKLTNINETPVFIYKKKKILENAKKFLKIDNVIPFYAIKANYNRKIIKLLEKNGFNFEVVSIGEIMFLIKNKIKGNRMLFSGVCKEEKDIKNAIKKKIGFINVESMEELKILNKFRGYKTKILLKFNLNLKVNTKKEVTTCKEENKFGIRKKKINKVIKFIKEKKIPIYGFSFHLGSQISSNRPYINGFKKIIKISKSNKIKIKAINIGGGFSIKYREKDKKHNLIALKKISEFCKRKKISLFTEPGRYIVADSCNTIARVVRIKKTKKKNIAIINIGMESIIRPALYGSFHRIDKINKTGKKKRTYEVVGPICESTDILSKKTKIERIRKGDFLIIKDTGAYCLSMRMNYNMRSKPKEIFI